MKGSETCALLIGFERANERQNTKCTMSKTLTSTDILYKNTIVTNAYVLNLNSQFNICIN